MGKVASLLAAPAVLALTLTLPVQVTPRTTIPAEEKMPFTSATAGTLLNGVGIPEARLVDFEEEGMSAERLLTAEEDADADDATSNLDTGAIRQELRFNKYLMAAQMVLGPLFCVAVLTAGLSARKEAVVLFVTAGAGVLAAALVLIFAERGEEPGAQMARCFMGFIVAVVWIMAIADEVVNVLKVRVSPNPQSPIPLLTRPISSYSMFPNTDIRLHLRPLRRPHRTHHLRRRELPRRLRRQHLRRVLRAPNGLRRLLRRAHAQHPPRRRRLGHVRRARRGWGAVQAELRADACGERGGVVGVAGRDDGCGADEGV
jgi:hypothetical protein